MRHFRDEIRVEAPVERVWAVLCDTSRMSDWARWSTFSDFSGPLDQVGTTYTDTTRLTGFTATVVSEVVEVDPLRLYHERTDTGPADLVIRLEPDGDATRLLVECDYEIPGKLPGFVKAVLAKVWGEPKTRQMMARLKVIAEDNVPGTT